VVKPDLRNGAWSGKFAVVEAVVLEDGTVSEIRPIEGNDQKLMTMLISAAAKCRFTPGQCDGRLERQYVEFSLGTRPVRPAA